MSRAANHRRGNIPLGDSPPNHHVARVERLLLDELNMMLRDELTDYELEEVVVHEVNLSPDLRLARVHYHLSSGGLPAEIREAQNTLERLSGEFRSDLAETLDLRRIPTLKFVYAPGVRQESEQDA